MRKTLLFVCTVLVWSVSKSQPCTPVTNFPGNQGILPLALDSGFIDSAYNQVIDFKAPLDTTVTFNNNTLNFRVDSLRIVRVIGLPDGISYQCHNSACMVNGGQTGCAVLSGTPRQGGVFPLKVVIRTNGRLQEFIPIPISNNDTNERYTLYIFPFTGISGVYKEKLILQIYPNPATDRVSIHTGPTYEGYVSIMDMSGKLLYRKELFETTGNEHTLHTADWPKGIYIVTWQNGIYAQREKLVIH